MKFMRTLHKWLALVVGVQMAVWLVSGLAMSLLDAEKVSGRSTAALGHDAALLPADASIVEPAVLVERHAPAAVLGVELQHRLGRWLWRVQTGDAIVLHDAHSGEIVRIDEPLARRIAQNGYAGSGAIDSAALVRTPTLEARAHDLPLWRIQFDDPQRTRYYISVDDGRILERRTAAWRVFDFFWMLHTMDYAGRDDFNNPWVVAFAFLSLVLAVTGTVLLIRWGYVSLARRAARARAPIRPACGQ